MNDLIIKVQDIQFNYPGWAKAINGITFEITRGEKVAILGQNGSGKSTLILLIAGLLTPKKGEIRVFNEKTTSKTFQKLRQRIGIVFQDPDDQLFTLSVIDDIEYGPRNVQLPEKDIKERSSHVLEKIGIPHLKERPPHRLSFGEKKKVSLATALVLKPELLILDEPTSNLDLTSRRRLINILNEMNKIGTTIVIATHDVEVLHELVDRIIVIDHGTLFGQGHTREILQNLELLESAGLEPPSIVKLFLELKSKGLIKYVPITVNEAQKEFINMHDK
jgi:cobalt/nickel transport system ATP-binding protein